jgi:hypothetical protein
MMKLSLETKRMKPGLELPLQVQSFSPSGLVVLTTDEAPFELNEGLLGDPGQDTETLTFHLEKDGRQTTLQANLVWVEVTDSEEKQRRLELIVDTADEPGWWEVHSALTRE